MTHRGLRSCPPLAALAAALVLTACLAGPRPAPDAAPGSEPEASPRASADAAATPEAEPPVIVDGMTPRELFEAHCSACHALDLAVAQRLDRANWEWVMEDMVEKYGATWLTAEHQEVILDYVTEHYGRPAGRLLK